jgi:asparagine synthase (glutamine-hydrolysing)
MLPKAAPPQHMTAAQLHVPTHRSLLETNGVFPPRGRGIDIDSLRRALDLGEDSVAALLRQWCGPFAVGLYSAAGNRAVLAVDRFAVHTACWSWRNGELRFAERADELAGADTAIDTQAVFDYLYFHCIPSPRTVFHGVHRLPPGHFLWFDQGAVRVAPYWRPSFCPARPGSKDFCALRNEFRGLLEVAVRDATADGPAACFLSGGTDSSTVAGMLGRAAGTAPLTFSIGFEAQGYDEMAYARIAAKHFGTVHHEYYVTPGDLVRSISDVARWYDQPFGNSSALPAYYCARHAREHGVAHLLAGDGGDELFGGNSRYAMQRIFSWYAAVPGPLRQGLLEPVFGRSPIGALPLLRKGRGYIRQARLPMPDRLESYNLLLRLGISDVLTPGFLALADSNAPISLQREVWGQGDAADDLNRNLAFDWRFTLAESDIPKVRGATGMAGVGVSYPLLDPRLVDFSLMLPTSYKLRGLKLRWFFKEALRGFLPDAILAKKKHGFGLPFGVWVHSNPALRALASDSLASFAQRGIVKPEFIRALFEQHLPAHPGYYGEMVWILMMLEQWLQYHRPGYRL